MTNERKSKVRLGLSEKKIVKELVDAGIFKLQKQVFLLGAALGIKNAEKLPLSVPSETSWEMNSFVEEEASLIQLVKAKIDSGSASMSHKEAWEELEQYGTWGIKKIYEKYNDGELKLLELMD